MIFVRHKNSIYFLVGLAFSNVQSKLHHIFKGSKPPWPGCESSAFIVRIAKVDLRQHLKMHVFVDRERIIKWTPGSDNTTLMGRTNMEVQHDTER
jgi:hypothetical protein